MSHLRRRTMSVWVGFTDGKPDVYPLRLACCNPEHERGEQLILEIYAIKRGMPYEDRRRVEISWMEEWQPVGKSDAR